MKLSEAKWFRGVYRRIHTILSRGGRLPEPEKITVLNKAPTPVAPTVLAVAAPEESAVWFRETPPNPVTFAHELIHLAEKAGVVGEEVYGYNLAMFVVRLAEENITPEKNPLSLFEGVTAEQLLSAISKVYGYRFSSVAEFFTHIGVIPPFLTLEGGEVRVDPRYSEAEIVIEAISELSAGTEFFEEHLWVLLELLM